MIKLLNIVNTWVHSYCLIQDHNGFHKTLLEQALCHGFSTHCTLALFLASCPSWSKSPLPVKGDLIGWT